MLTKIILVQKAECDGNVQDKLSGMTNFDITKKGVKQIKDLAKKLEKVKIDIIIF